jgi:[ribosomal protein S18]-alanine N-acetyltransferase
MNAWRVLRDPAVAVRLAAPADRAAVAALLAGTWRRHGSGSLEDQAALLANGFSAVAFVGPDAVGFLGVDLRAPAERGNERWADIQLVAAEAGRRGEGLLGQLVDTTLPILQNQACTGLVALAPPGWLSEGLSKGGFRVEDQVVTYARSDGEAPRQSQHGGRVRLRAASAADAPSILTLNALAFEPLWRYDDSVIVGWLMDSDHAVVAEIDGHVAGFALTTAGLTGNYSHLIRVATHPDFRGFGVGRRLVVDSIRHARENSAPGLALNTQASNEVSRRLYESLGFRLTGHSLNVLTARL